MQEKLDNKFSQKVKEVFENRQEPYNHEDWEKLKAKKDRAKDRFIFWFFGKSTAIALLFLIIGGTGGLVLYNALQTTTINNEDDIIIGDTNSTENDDNLIQDSLKNPIYNPYKKTIENSVDDYNIVKTNNNNDIKNNKIEDENNLKKLNNEHNNKIETKKINEHNAIASMQQKNKNQYNPSLNEKQINPKSSKDSTNAFIKKSKLFALNSEIADSLKTNQTKIIANTSKLAENLEKQEKLAVNSNTFNPSDSLTINEIELALEKTNGTETKNRAVTFSLVLSPIINYNQANQNSDINFGGGILLDIPIFKNFDIYTGILIVNQRIDFQENTLQEVSSGKQLKSKKSVLTGLDIPINLKYNFEMNTNKMFVAVGLSSVTYLKENIESTYQISSTVLTESVDVFGNSILVSNTITTLEKETESLGTFNNFYFGKIINLSFGIELPFKNSRQSITIEPYFKYALGAITSENINFSSGGLNLELNLNGRKKSE
ncbi:MAG: hypothetical protein COC16_04025 [Lutibacter sp.]|nr:MAG: hypothetical protein COC16_04025 [Lutibacter sp.]